MRGYTLMRVAGLMHYGLLPHPVEKSLNVQRSSLQLTDTRCVSFVYLLDVESLLLFLLINIIFISLVLIVVYAICHMYHALPSKHVRQSTLDIFDIHIIIQLFELRIHMAHAYACPKIFIGLYGLKVKTNN